MADDTFNVAEAFAKLNGRLDVLSEKQESTRMLLEKELVPIRAEIDNLKADSIHCDADRKTMSETFSARLERVENKIAIDPARAKVIDDMIEANRKTADNNASAIGKIDTTIRLVFAGLGAAWAAIIAISVAIINHPHV